MRTNCLNVGLGRCVAILAIAVLAAANSGCMLSPNNGERLSDRDERFGMSIATLQEETVQVQARNQTTGAWQNVGTVETGSSVFPYAGYDWHYGTSNIQVPRECWKLFLAGSSVDRIYYRSELRAITSDGYPVATFRNGFFEWFADGLYWDGTRYQIDRSTDEVDERYNGSTMHLYTRTISL